MSLGESIAVLEALLGLGLEEIVVFADDDRPMTLARALRISPARQRGSEWRLARSSPPDRRPA